MLRSLHRYAADAFVLVIGAAPRRAKLVPAALRGFRALPWLTGVPSLWLVYASGIGGYWLVWDKLAQFSA